MGRAIEAAIAGVRRVALVGLAKNTGKTETLGAILRGQAAAGVRVGVTSIGRDGEERDALDARIAKPRVRLPEGSLVATTGTLLRASGLAHSRRRDTGVRTPLGQVVVAELGEPGTIEIAGPSGAQDMRAVCDAMRKMGAEQVLIDGAIDRRAASSPAVSDGLVMATGAILDEDMERVVEITRRAVELVRLPAAGDGGGPSSGEYGEPIAAAEASDGDPAAMTGTAEAPDENGPVTVPSGLVLRAEPREIAAWLGEHPRAHRLRVEGALGERFLQGLLDARRERAARELTIVAGDPTKVFLRSRGPGWYGRQGASIEVAERIELRAITVNPVAPRAHRFDSRALREAVEAAVPGVPVLDVLDGG